jgi:hypothetical protein
LERKHLVQTFIRFGTPLTTTLTLWVFGFHWRLVLICEWLYFLPKVTPFPQTSHLAMLIPLSIITINILPNPAGNSNKQE